MTETRQARQPRHAALPAGDRRRYRSWSAPSTARRRRCNWAAANWCRRWRPASKAWPSASATSSCSKPEQAFGPHNPELVQRLRAQRTAGRRRTIEARSAMIEFSAPGRRHIHRPGARTGCRFGADRLQSSAGRQGRCVSKSRSWGYSDGHPARQSARLLRRRRTRHRHRREGAGTVRRADLRPPRSRAQQLRRRQPARQGRRVRRRTRPGARWRDGHLQRPRRVRRPCRPKRRGAACASSTPPARW